MVDAVAENEESLVATQYLEDYAWEMSSKSSWIFQKQSSEYNVVSRKKVEALAKRLCSCCSKPEASRVWVKHKYVNAR